ncbi:MFS transporter [Candidatus Tisiphia endosymbiont of Hybos culiciformis]|uniref:MFS transporter n=1 Tax=Candidatus Tisiphia endosymbiont of Hybos culiciformis TaxID=3139331 RepID=UPI003CCA78BC
MSKFIQSDGRVIYTQTSLTKEQKEAAGLLSIGTFLEYFDMMLYIHMAVLLNELFFEPADPYTASLMSAFAFCSAYALRPIGALVFGWLGDNIGRKTTVIITTFIMALACFVIAVLPTYEQIGFSASCILTLCRIMQGMAAMGEGTGAELYLTETIKPPMRYPIAGLPATFSAIGATSALAVASFVTSFGLNWRLAFFVGAVVALIGTIARTTLRETPDFADAKKRLSQIVEDLDKNPQLLQDSVIWKEKVKVKTAFSLFLIQCMWPVAFYFIYIHCGNILKNSFGYSAEQVIHQNFVVSSGQLISYLLIVYLSYKIYPLHIIKTKLRMFAFLVLICPYLLDNITSGVLQLMFLQIFMVITVPTDFPAASIFYMHFPVFKRYTYACLMYALSRAIMSIIVSFGLVYLINYFGNWGIWVIMLPIIWGYKFGLSHFETLEKMAGNYPEKKNSSVYNSHQIL